MTHSTDHELTHVSRCFAVDNSTLFYGHLRFLEVLCRFCIKDITAFLNETKTLVIEEHVKRQDFPFDGQTDKCPVNACT